MDRAEEYRKKADDCRRMAATWASDEHRTAWLDLANSWLELARSTSGRPGGVQWDIERSALAIAKPAGSKSLH